MLCKNFRKGKYFFITAKQKVKKDLVKKINRLGA
jgi:hypothetical protein